ncbi:hypothetical protein RJ639_018775 [Escallonia herrerae]|uniref:Protein kinase domain-containing protein n=1 Tax=Escallonia herrerae TaxID=1293975 RepID=A0AA89AHZ7_9ASTE|nr:hypothetical protein RJ639_018775 [Escallonia herrerae]
MSQVLLLLIFCLLFRIQEATAPIAKPGCQERCGNLIVPFPFGIGAGCYLDKTFRVICSEDAERVSGSPLYFATGLSILELSLEYVRAQVGATPNCYSKSGTGTLLSSAYGAEPHFRYSHTRNRFVGIGCDIFAYITGIGSTNYTSGCAALCDTTNPIVELSDTTYSGIGCCQSTILNDIVAFDLQIHSINTLSRPWTTKPCSIAFFADKSIYVLVINISETNTWGTVYSIPLVLDWVVGNTTCQEAQANGMYACGQNSGCFNSTDGAGYNCRCLEGYQGNPYLPYGCQAIAKLTDKDALQLLIKSRMRSKRNLLNEDYIKHNHLILWMIFELHEHISTSVNSHKATVAKMVLFVLIHLGITHALALMVTTKLEMNVYMDANLANGDVNWQKLFPKELELLFYSSTHLLFGFIANLSKQGSISSNIYRFFKRINGGLLLQHHISSSKASATKTKLYTAEEIEKATDYFNKSRILGKGGQGTVYKGMLPDGSIVAVKKSNVVDEDQAARFVNEVYILSQMNHRNSLRCHYWCEYVSGGTLSHHLYDEGHVSTLSWKTRLQIAGEVAGALAYLHSYASIAVFHSDIKSSNILLDENYRAVLSDFGISRSLSLTKTHLTTFVGGTFGYLDPLYFRTGQYTEKTDAYAFGVVVAELLTGRKAVSLNSSDEGLAAKFHLSMKRNCLFEILESLVVTEGQKEEILTVANLAKRCLKLNAKKRPSMKEVAADLDRLRRIQETTDALTITQKMPTAPMLNSLVSRNGHSHRD